MNVIQAQFLIPIFLFLILIIFLFDVRVFVHKNEITEFFACQKTEKVQNPEYVKERDLWLENCNRKMSRSSFLETECKLESYNVKFQEPYTIDIIVDTTCEKTVGWNYLVYFKILSDNSKYIYLFSFSY